MALERAGAARSRLFVSWALALAALSDCGCGGNRPNAPIDCESIVTPRIDSSPVQEGTVGAPYTYEVSLTGEQVSLVKKSGPEWLTVSGTTASGTPTSEGTFDVVLEAAVQGCADKAVSQAYQVTVSPGSGGCTVHITSPAAPASVNGLVGVSYDVASPLAAFAADTSGVTWSVVTGSAPEGTALQSDSGLLTGTPTTAGAVQFTVQASKPGCSSATLDVNATVQFLDISTGSPLPDGAKDVAYGPLQLEATLDGAPATGLTWNVAPGSTLPAGLSLSNGGVLSGTPTVAGTQSFGVRVGRSATEFVEETFALTITGSNTAVVITSADNAQAPVNQPFSFTATASVTPADDVTWSIAAGTLPSGLSLESTTGVISGAPTAPGDYDFTLAAAAGDGMATQVFSLAVVQPPVVTAGVDVNHRQGVTFSYTPSATSDAGPVTWALLTPCTSLLSNLPMNDASVFDQSSGAIQNWVPLETGSCAVTLRATNSAGSTGSALYPDVTFTVTVGEPPVLSGIAASYNVLSGEAFTVSVTHNPPASSFVCTGPSWATPGSCASNGVFSGTAPIVTVGTTENFSIEGSNAFGTSAVLTFDVTTQPVASGPALITSTASPLTVIEGQPWTYNATAGPASSGQPVVWQLSTAQAGVQVASSIAAPTYGTTATVSWAAANPTACTPMPGAPCAVAISLTVDNDGAGSNPPNTQAFNLLVYPVPPTPAIQTVATRPLPQVPVAGPGNAYSGSGFTYSPALTPATDVGTDGITPPAPVTWALDLGLSTCDDGFGMGAASIDPDNGQVSFAVPAGVTGSCTFHVTATRTDYGGAGNSGARTFTIDVVEQPASPAFTSTPPDWVSTFTPAPPSGTLISGVDSYPGYSPVVTGNPTPTVTASGVPAWLEWTGSSLQMASGESTIPAGVFGSFSITLTAANGVNPDATQVISFDVIEPPPTVASITPAFARRQANVPVTVRGAGFTGVTALKLCRSGTACAGADATLVTTGFAVSAGAVTATVDADLARPAGVYDVVLVKSGIDYPLARRFIVTSGGNGTTVTGNITTDTTWVAANSPYLVTGDISVQNSATLTIQPGTVVMFGNGVAGQENNRLIFNVGVAGLGTLVANGGDPGTGDPIVFSSEQPDTGTAVAGSWAGLRFGANTGGSTVLRNVVVEFGGGNTNSAPGGGLINGAVELQNGVTSVNISRSIIRETQRHGLYLGNGAGAFSSPAWFDQVELANAGQTAGYYPVSASANAVATLGANLTFSRNVPSTVPSRIQVRNATSIDRGTGTPLTATWRRYAGVEYLANGTLTVGSNVTLSIAPGNTVRFPTDARLDVGVSTAAALSINAAANNVVLRAEDGAATDTWDGVRIGRPALASSLSTTLRGVQILEFDGDYAAGLRLNDPTAVADCDPVYNGNCVVTPRVTVDQSVISTTKGSAGTAGQDCGGGRSCAVYLDANARLASLANTRLSAAHRAASAQADDVHSLLNATNQYEQRVLARSAVIHVSRNPVGSTTWAGISNSGGAAQPVELLGSVTTANTSLQVGAGSILELGANTELWGGYNGDCDPFTSGTQQCSGQLVLAGTAARPVTVRPLSGVANWDRIVLYGNLSPSALSSTTYAVLENAGSADPTASEGLAAIRVVCAGSNCATPSITQTTVTGSNNHGITFAANTYASAFDNNTVTGSRYTGLRLRANFVGRTMGAGNALAGNNTSGTLGHEGVYVDGMTIDTSAVWPLLDVPYVIINGNLNVARGGSPVTLTLEPGVELRFQTNRWLLVGSGGFGELVANGLPGSRITLTSWNPAGPNYWQGVRFYFSSTGSSSLTYADVSYGGAGGGNAGNLYFDTNTTGTVVGNVTLTNSFRYAGYRNSSAAPAFQAGTVAASGNLAGDCIQNFPAGLCTLP